MTARGRILVVDDKAGMRSLLRDILSAQHDITLAVDGGEAEKHLETAGVAVVLTDVRMPFADGLALAQTVKRRWPGTEVVLMTAHASVRAAVESMRRGSYDYLEKPFASDHVNLVVARALARSSERRESARLGQNAASDPSATPTPDNRELAELSYHEALVAARDRGSRDYLAALLTAFAGNVSRAAAKAGLERESLHRLLRRHGLRAEAFRDVGSGEHAQ